MIYFFTEQSELEARLNTTDVQAATQRALVAQLQVEIKGNTCRDYCIGAMWDMRNQKTPDRAVEIKI